MVRPRRYPGLRDARACGAPAKAIASSSSICVRLARPAIRQKRSKLAPTEARAPSTAAVSPAARASARGDVMVFSTLLLSIWI